MDNLITSTKAASGRVGLKIGALFFVVFFGYIGLFFVKDLLGLFSARSDQAVRPEEVTVIDPKIEADLKRVMEQPELPQLSDLKDPFRDRADLSGEMEKLSGGAGATPSATPAAGGAQQPGGSQAGGAEQPRDGGQGGAATIKPADPVAETKSRYDERERRILNGLPAVAESEVFAVDDLVPVGDVSGGAGVQEVILFSRALKKTISLPIGSRLFDGQILEVRPEGVAFVVFGKVSTTRVKLWRTSVKDLSYLPGFGEDLKWRETGVRCGEVVA